MPKIKTCLICGKEFEVKPVYYARSKYCSAVCFGKSRRTKVEKTCKNCKNRFMFAPSQTNTYSNAGKYCSRKCAYEYRVKINAAKPTEDRYGRTKRKADIEWKVAVRKKYNNTCQRCWKQEPYIHAHHIVLRSQAPELKHDVDNGITLCNSCHTWVHHHPQEAKKLGFIKERPVLTTHQMPVVT